MTDDAQLIDDALSGVSAAFGRLVAKYQDRLFNTIVHVIGSRDEAEDIVQDAFVQAFVRLDSFRRTSAFYTWLYRIAVNLAISRKRRHRPSQSVEERRDIAGEEPVGRDHDPSEPMEQRERAEQVQAALAALSAEHRTVLVLREIEGCSYETIAEIVEAPVGTVRSRLHRARIEMRDQLRQALQEDLT